MTGNQTTPTPIPPSWVLIPGTDICRECGNHLLTQAGLLARCRDRHEVQR